MPILKLPFDAIFSTGDLAHDLGAADNRLANTYTRDLFATDIDASGNLDIDGNSYFYNTYTDDSNYERAELTWVGNVAYLRTSSSGTGTLRDLYLDGLQIRVLTNVLPGTTDSYTLGSNSRQWSAVHATTINVGTINADSLPTSDPAVAGDFWNDGGAVKVSAG